MKVLTLDSLDHFISKFKELIPGLATKSNPGLVPELPEDDTLVLKSDGTWGEQVNNNIGLISLDIHEDGHLYLIYDDNVGEPNLSVEQDGPLAGHLIWRYSIEE